MSRFRTDLVSNYLLARFCGRGRVRSACRALVMARGQARTRRLLYRP